MISGEPWSFANWDNGEPNGTAETRMNFFSNDAEPGNPIRQSFWNNVPPAGGLLGYIIEYDQYQVPGPLALLAIDLPGLLLGRRPAR